MRKTSTRQRTVNFFVEEKDVPTRNWKYHERFPWLVMPVRRNSLRSYGADYSNAECICFVTFCLLKGRTDLRDGRNALTCVEMLKVLRRSWGFRVFAFTIMPDHVHLLVSPSGKGETVSGIVQKLKEKVTRRLKEKAGMLWQRGLYDHLLKDSEKKSETFAQIVGYVLANPVRWGLTKCWDEYPYCGRLD